VLRFTEFIKKNKYYETSILDESLENTKINKKEFLKENIESYKNKLLSSYWTEINLIGYKIELLEKQKVEYPKEELKSRIIYIGNKISNYNFILIISKILLIRTNWANFKNIFPIVIKNKFYL